ncbi:MAG: efflux RND transporter periplasmic adaptor subunit [Gemmatimonadaceae bacterium]
MSKHCRSSRILAALLAVSGLEMIACKQSGTNAGDSTTPSAAVQAATEAASGKKDSVQLPVVAEEARDGDLVLRVNTTGLIRSDAVVKLSAEVGGVVLQTPVRAGSIVKKGDVIIKLDPYPFELAVREAQSKLEEAQQRFQEAFVPESLVTGRGPTAEQRRVFGIKAGLAGVRLVLERAQSDQAKAVVVSPIDGTMDAVFVSPGERLSSGQPIGTVVDTRNLRVEAQVLEHDLALLHAGGEAFVTSAGAPGKEMHGRIEAILPLVDSATRAGRAVVRLPSGGQLRPGMYADVQLESVRLTHRRLVPSRAVIERDGRPLVFVVRDGRAQWTYILPGRSNGIDTEVLPDSVSGVIPVNAGDRVIVDGHLTLTHDAPVRITVLRDKSATGMADTARKSRTK